MQGSNESRALGRKPLEDASYEELTAALSQRLEQDRTAHAQKLAELTEAEVRLEGKKRQLEDMGQKIFAVIGNTEDVVELNVGGQYMSTTRAVLCSAQGSLLAGMFSGNFDDGLKKDKDGRFFLDVDPDLFKKVLSHLRLRRVASPDFPAPLPMVPEDSRSEFHLLIKYLGLEQFMYGDGLGGNIFQRLAELTGYPQARLQTNDVISITLSSTGGVPAANHEEVLSVTGFHERSLENSYGAHPNTITIRFKKHRVKVDAMELRAKAADVLAHMSNKWTFRHGTVNVDMFHAFSRAEPHTGKLEVSVGSVFTDEVQWTFPKAHPNTITIRFKKHRVKVDAMELRAKAADVLAHMSNKWTFRHGTVNVDMFHAFSRAEPHTGKLEVSVGSVFTDEVQWTFPKDFCLEHIVLHGRVMPW